jgi:gamma-glutamyl-gamma-aminobutyrate hydrolase PuuD
MTYSNSVIKAGGIPVLIPITTDSLVLRDILTRVDGLLLIGGGDIHPSYYGEAPIPELGEVDELRDVYDITLIRVAHDMNIPMFGVCRGEQLMNVALGGSLYQDIPSQHPDTTVKHRQRVDGTVATHLVKFEEGSILREVIGQSELMTNSFHHQAVKKVAPGFRVSAWASDSIPEAIESTEGKPMWGVQFHPEYQTDNGDEISARFFYFFIEIVVNTGKA